MLLNHWQPYPIRPLFCMLGQLDRKYDAGDKEDQTQAQTEPESVQRLHHVFADNVLHRVNGCGHRPTTTHLLCQVCPLSVCDGDVAQLTVNELSVFILNELRCVVVEEVLRCSNYAQHLIHVASKLVDG